MSEVDQIVQYCGDESVCLYDGATISNAGALEASLPDGVKVVVIPQPDAAQSVPSSTIASGVKQATGDTTVIVIENRATDRFFVASDGDATGIAEALYSQNQPDGGIAVTSISSQLTQQPVASDAGDGGGFGGGLFVIIGIVVVLGAVAGGIAAAVRQSKRGAQRRGISSRRLERELDESLNGADGEFIQDAMKQLLDRAAALPYLGVALSSLHRHVSELFVRVRRRGTDQQIRLLQSQYKDTLGKLLKALDNDYYGDIRANPQYWSNPEARIVEVQRAVGSVDQQAVENIRQVNESRDLEFQVALDSLIRTVDEAKLSDVYTDRDKK